MAEDEDKRDDTGPPPSPVVAPQGQSPPPHAGAPPGAQSPPPAGATHGAHGHISPPAGAPQEGPKGYTSPPKGALKGADGQGPPPVSPFRKRSRESAGDGDGNVDGGGERLMAGGAIKMTKVAAGSLEKVTFRLDQFRFS